MGANAAFSTPSTPSAADQLRGAGLRATRVRVAVHSTLAALGGHRSADEVHDQLVSRGERVSRTSVYNALEVLTRTGLVMAADAGPGRALYEVSDLWHHHAVCRVCGAVSDVECVIGAKPCLEASGDWGEVDEAQVIFRGVCRRCTESRRSNTESRRSSAERNDRAQSETREHRAKRSQ